MERMNILHFTPDECEVLMYLIDVEAYEATLEIVATSIPDSIKSTRICNGLKQLFFIRALFALQAQNQNATIQLNELGLTIMSSILQLGKINDAPDHVIAGFNSQYDVMLSKFNDIDIPEPTAKLS